MCTCPKGWPKSEERDFGNHADSIAQLYGIPAPRFGVTAHRAPCDLADVPHYIPEDYSHPKDFPHLDT